MVARPLLVEDRTQARAEVFWRSLAGHIAEATPPRAALGDLRTSFARRTPRTLLDDIGGALAGAAFLWLLLLVT